MTPFISYLLKANLALLLLYGLYYLCLRRDTFYGHIRWYLLAAIVAVFAFPLVDASSWLAGSAVAAITAETSQHPIDTNAVYQYMFAQPQAEQTVEQTSTKAIPLSSIIWWCWLPVTIFLAGRRLLQLASLIRLCCYCPRQYHGGRMIIAIDSNMQPFSFFGRIFLNPSLYSNTELDEIVAHERVHCRQGHTADILLAEAIVCLCWFNPVAWLLRRDLKQNLEYYTDRMTLLSGFDRKHYQYSLLRVSGSAFQIVNHFQFNHLKKRIIMMNKKESPRILAAKYLLVVPVLAAALLTMQIPGLQAKEPAGADNPAQVNITIRSADGLSSVIHVDGKKDTPVDMLFTDKDGQQLTLTAMGMSMSMPDSGKKINRLSELTIEGAAIGKDVLVILDGEPISQNEMDNIDPLSIEEISILKDATTQSSLNHNKNGVIVITTKNSADFISLNPKKKLFKLNFSKQNNDSIIPDYRTRQGIPQTPSGDNDLTEYNLNNPSPSETFLFGTMEPGTKGDNSFINTSVKRYSYPSTSENKDQIVLTTTEEGDGAVKKTVSHVVFVDKGKQPLFVVDGAIINSLADISPSDIDTLTVLKDKTAVDLYGEKAKNGVILVTTKKK